MKTAMRRFLLSVLAAILVISLSLGLKSCSNAPHEYQLIVGGFEFVEPASYDHEGEYQEPEAAEADLLVLSPYDGTVEKEIDAWLSDLASLVQKTVETISWSDVKGLTFKTPLVYHVEGGVQVSVFRGEQSLGSLFLHDD